MITIWDDFLSAPSVSALDLARFWVSPDLTEYEIGEWFHYQIGEGKQSNGHIQAEADILAMLTEMVDQGARFTITPKLVRDVRLLAAGFIVRLQMQDADRAFYDAQAQQRIDQQQRLPRPSQLMEEAALA